MDRSWHQCSSENMFAACLMEVICAIPTHNEAIEFNPSGKEQPGHGDLAGLSTLLSYAGR